MLWIRGPMILLEIKNFCLSLKKVPILKGINLVLNEKERLGIVGESGSGKSTLVKAILKLHPPQSVCIEQGTISYKGIDITHFSEKQMQTLRGKEIGIIFQDPMSSLNPTLSIGYQIDEGFMCHNPHITRKEAQENTLKLLAATGILDPAIRYKSYPHTLSGGMRQRVMIAMALAANPSLLIADEVTTALDVLRQAQILKLIATLQKDKSLIFITHDLSIAATFCDRLIVMKEGLIVEQASTEEIFLNPQHTYTKHLVNLMPRSSCHNL